MPSAIAIHILYATATSTAEDIAHLLSESLLHHAIHPLSCTPIDDYPLALLPLHASQGQLFIFIVSTCGDGDVPHNMRKFWQFVRRVDLPRGVLTDLKYTVFGLGDRAYVKFNAAARKLNRRLMDLGAKQIVPIGLGDESAQGGIDKELWPWWTRVCGALVKGYEERNGGVEAIRTVESRIAIRIVGEVNEEEKLGVEYRRNAWRKGLARIGGGLGMGKLVESHVVENRLLTNATFLTDEREVRHIALDVSGAAAECGFRDYKAGDVLHVMPRNRSSAVDAFFQLTGFAETSLITLDETGSKKRFGRYTLNVSLPCTLREFVSVQLDLSAMPRRRFCQRLAPFASDEQQRDKLLEFASANGVEALTQYAYREKRTILMVLRDFPSARPPLDDLVDMIPVLKTRAFSIASSVAAHQGRVQICAAMVCYTTPLRFVRVGVCSAFFKALQVGDVVPVYLECGTSLRFSNKMAAIMIGPGTGVAPMRSFISGCASGNSCERVLYFGCRSRGGDFLYDDEWEKYMQYKQLTSITPAFSRETDKKVYVQDRMREQGEQLWRLMWKEGAKVYVAGAAGSMPKGVRETLVDICVKEGKLSGADAESFVVKMEVEGRLQMECW